MKILIPENNASCRDAAEVFAGLWNAVTGSTLEIVTSDDGVSDLAVFGNDAENEFTAECILNGSMPNFRIRYGTDDYHLLAVRLGTRNILFLAAGNLRAKFYAVYNFFERAAGCSYFWDGDRIPKKQNISIEGFDAAESPRFEYRGLRYFAHRSLFRFQAEHWDFEDWKKEIDWIMKKRLNLAMLRIGIDDLFQKAFPETVPYPEYDNPLPESAPRSFDDRNLFWPLEYRGELRKKVLAYGRSRGLWQPEDCGTMTHWYSRTPQTFLDQFQPSFLPQSDNNYRTRGETTGLVWDIRDDVNLDRYMALTDAHVKYYGSGEMFHTIGIAERHCFTDARKNHQLKLYAYRRILGKLQEKYPHAPMLIASWDFISTWTHGEVQSLIAELDPANTIVLDYTSDIWDDRNNFQNWNLLGKFPWIFGIFHAYEASNEIRGDYSRIEDRFPKAAADPMCKGLVFWPENSHQDTLMLDYFPAIAWHPEQFRIEEFIHGFCRRRYPEELSAKMDGIWHKILPLANLSLWGSVSPDTSMREVYPDLYFGIATSKKWFFGDLDATRLEYCFWQCRRTAPHFAAAKEILQELAGLDFGSLESGTKRDVLDLARTVFSRVMTCALAKLALSIESWRENTPLPTDEIKIISGEELCAYAETVGSFGKCLAEMLEASADFSLSASLEELRKRHTTNPHFENTLKGNAENGYCRSFIYELAKECYEPEFKVLENLIRERVQKNDRRAWAGLSETFGARGAEIQDAFYAKPLAEMAPDIPSGWKKLPETLMKTAEIISLL